MPEKVPGKILPALEEDRIQYLETSWVDDLQYAANVVLTSIQDVAAYSDITLPERQIIYISTTPQDTEQVAVTVSGLGFGRPGDPMQGPGTCWWPKRATITASITRCVPQDNQVQGQGRYATGIVTLPSDNSMEDHARTMMRDMSVLLEAANIASNYPQPGTGTEASVLVGDPQSGYQTSYLSIVMQV